MNAREILMQDIIKAVQNGATAVRNNCPNNEGDQTSIYCSCI
jgi:hypothetical protein